MEHRSPIQNRAAFDGGTVHGTGRTTGAGDNEPWCGILDNASPRDHIVQLYQDQQFLNRAVCRFAAAALANGEGVILVPTIAHWDAFRPRIESEGVDVDAAVRRGQLSIVDANDLLPISCVTPCLIHRSLWDWPRMSSRGPAGTAGIRGCDGGVRW